MGIKKLLTVLDVIQNGTLEELRGKTVGIDGYSWIHKCVYNVGHELVVQKDYSQYMAKIENRFELLRKFNIKIVVVFDGDKLPSKSGTEENREERRDKKREMANLLLQQGNHMEANKRFAESFDVTPQFAYETLQYLRRRNINLECSTFLKAGIVAPYEADAQLGYLSKINYIDAVIAEDSDMLVFGAKSLILKLDPTGNFQRVNLLDLGSVSYQ